MQGTTITRRFTFAAGHRVMGHENKCRHLHGHNWAVLLTMAPTSGRRVSRRGLDELGRVLDFGEVKARLGTLIDDELDHAFLVASDDREALEAVQRVKGQRVTVFGFNPTAEHLARWFVMDAGPRALDGTGVEVVRAEVWETDNCCASFEVES